MKTEASRSDRTERSYALGVEMEETDGPADKEVDSESMSCVDDGEWRALYRHQTCVGITLSHP